MGLEAILPKANNGHRVICSLTTALALFIEISYYAAAVVFDAIVDVEVSTQSTLAGQLFQVIVDKPLKYFEICNTHHFHSLGIVLT